jgi:nitrogenase subunit NifH
MKIPLIPTSYLLMFSCHCHLFLTTGQDGAKKMAEELDIDLVGDIPLNIEIRETADGGRPIVVSKPDSPQAQAYRDIALKIICKLKL